MWFLLKGTVSEVEFVSDKLIGIQKILLDHGLQRVFKFFFLDSQEGSPPPGGTSHLALLLEATVVLSQCISWQSEDFWLVQ